MTWHAKSTWRALQKRPRLYWAGAIRSVCHRIQKHNRQQHTHTHTYIDNTHGAEGPVHFAVVVVALSLSLSSRTVWGHTITLSKERGWGEGEKRKEKKTKRDQVIVNTLCLIILVVLLFLLSLSYFPPTSPLFFCVLFFFFFFQYFLGSSLLFCYGPVDKRTNRQTFAGLVVNISLVYKKDPSVSFPLLTSNWETKFSLSRVLFS